MRIIPLKLTIFIIFFNSIILDAYANSYTAFSFKIAYEQRNKSSDIHNCAGITRPIALVYDKETEDLIMVGERSNKLQPISLDDFVIALKAILKLRKDPAVSIDRTKDTEKTKLQKIRFEGGIENTKFGKDLLQADIILKRLGLGTELAETFGLKSYLYLSVEDFNRTGKQNRIVSRFWFQPDKSSSYVTARKDIVLVEEYKIGVHNQVMNAGDNIKRDPVGEQFALDLQNNFSDIKEYFPELKRLEQLYYVAALAQGLEKIIMPKSVLISYWLNDYEVTKVNIESEYKLEENSKKIKDVIIELSGGISLDTLVMDIQDGVVETIKKYILSCRPNQHSLSWEVPLIRLFRETIYQNFEIEKLKRTSGVIGNIGMSLFKTIKPINTNSLYHTDIFEPNISNISINEAPPSQEISPIKYQQPEYVSYNTTSFHDNNRFAMRPSTSNIGGVMLQGLAKIKGNASVHLSGGNFSFIVDGKNARLSPKSFRKFITALWSTYFTSQDPGISIDPIAPGSKKHLVLYIGQVMNNDLGKVMREADYVMKKWAVGTERPDINGFMNPDDISAKKNIYNVGASRFWFVPENMSFKRGGNMLIFDSGRMTVKTEYLFLNHETKADPANMEFANFFTDNYNKIAEKYPVYKELFEYAKLVSLTKYLKEKNIPLLWFLMANKDLVITEDSKSTVDALIKESEHHRNIRIEGGVELVSKGNYIYDEEAINAINDTVKNVPKNKKSETSSNNKENAVKTGSEKFSFNLKKGSFTVIPQHTLTSGKDRRGIRYQTDLAIKASGFKLTRRSLEYLKSIIFKQRESIKLKNIKINDRVEYELTCIQIHKKIFKEVNEIINKLNKLLNQDFESESELYSALIFTLGEEEAEKIKTLVLKYAYYKTNIELVRYYKPDNSNIADFGKGWFLLTPYKIQPLGIKTVQFNSLTLSFSMLIEDLISGHKEIMEYNNDRYDTPCYLPQDIEISQNLGLFLTRRGTFRLVDKIGNEFEFDEDGYITDMIFGDDHVIHYEYSDEFLDIFNNSPFKLKPVVDLKTTFSNIVIPQKILVINLASNNEENFSFISKWGIGAYIPNESDKYKKMVLKSDTTFRLFDKHDNEIAFNNSGVFIGIKKNKKNGKFIKSLSMGGHKINFTYNLYKNNIALISNAQLYNIEDRYEPLHSVHYVYDKKCRLAKVERIDPMKEQLSMK